MLADQFVSTDEKIQYAVDRSSASALDLLNTYEVVS